MNGNFTWLSTFTFLLPLALMVLGGRTVNGRQDSPGSQSPALQRVISWRNHNSLKDMETFERDWEVDGRVTVEGKSLRLVDNASIRSRFELEDRSSVMIAYFQDGRELLVTICDQMIRFEPDRIQGPENCVLRIHRKGKQLRFSQQIKGKLVRDDFIRLPESLAKEPCRIAINSQVRYMPNADVFLRGLYVTGKVRVQE